MTISHPQLYTRESVAEIDRAAIASGISGYTLMRRAGKAILDCVNKHYPSNSRLLVVCGAGNNAGDGYVLARLAGQAGYQVTVCSLISTDKLNGDASLACQHWLELGEVVEYEDVLLDDCDLVIDAILGTGLTREVEGEWKWCIGAINSSGKAIVSVDIPSGLNANTGCIQGAAINAQYTVSFIGLKQGMFTASGKQCCGEILFDDLAVAESIREQQAASAHLITDSILQKLPRRRHDSHKGDYGHVLIVGGNSGMAGAVALAAKATLSAGAGRVSAVTLPEHVAAVVSICPEAMVHSTATGQLDETQLAGITHCVIGPGLGKDAWARRLMYEVMQLDVPVLYDADALNLLAYSQQIPANTSVITPHSGEAGRLLETSAAEVQQDRFAAIKRLQERTGSVVVLKGSGSLVADDTGIMVSACGTPAMASAGMGDVLSGIIIALIAQQLSPTMAAATGVYAHARSAELAADGAQRGILASDVMAQLKVVLA